MTPSGNDHVRIGPGWLAIEALGVLALFIGASGWWDVWVALVIAGAVTVVVAWGSLTVRLFVLADFAHAQAKRRDGRGRRTEG